MEETGVEELEELNVKNMEEVKEKMKGVEGGYGWGMERGMLDMDRMEDV